MARIVNTLLLLLAAASLAEANWKKQYCGDNAYLPIGTKGYPHLHCHKNFMVYSVSKKNKVYMTDGGDVYCARIDMRRQDVNTHADIVTALNSLWGDHCVDQRFAARDAGAGAEGSLLRGNAA